MKLHLHIEHLALDGLPLMSHQETLVQATVERELTHLLANLTPAPWDAGTNAASIDGGAIRAAAPADPVGLGRQIAAAVHGGLKDTR